MAQPQLGYGHQTEASIDTVNQWMRSQPWWQQIAGSSSHLNDQQKQAILRAAQANGVVVDEGDMEIDPAGNFNPKGHKLRNTLIVAGIAGATIATMGAAGAFSGAAGAGGAAGGAGAGGAAVGAGAGAGTLASTAIGTGALGPIVGGAGLAGGAGAGGGAALGLGGYLSTAAKIGSALGDYSQGRADARLTESGAAQGANRNIIDLYQAQQQAANAENSFGLGKVSAGLGIGNLDLNQKQFALDAPGKRASNSVRGDILANAQDATVSGISPNIPVPKISGGLRPSMFSANTRALGGEMSTQALASQKAGDTFAPLPTVPDYVPGPSVPSLTDVPQAGKTDSILNTAGLVGSLASLIPYQRKKKPVVYDDQYNTGAN